MIEGKQGGGIFNRKKTTEIESTLGAAADTDKSAGTSSFSPLVPVVPVEPVRLIRDSMGTWR